MVYKFIRDVLRLSQRCEGRLDLMMTGAAVAFYYCWYCSMMYEALYTLLVLQKSNGFFTPQFIYFSTERKR